MEPGAVSYLPPTAARFITNDGMMSVSTIRIQENYFWGVRRGGKSANIVSRGNRNGI